MLAPSVEGETYCGVRFCALLLLSEAGTRIASVVFAPPRDGLPTAIVPKPPPCTAGRLVPPPGEHAASAAKMVGASETRYELLTDPALRAASAKSRCRSRDRYEKYCGMAQRCHLRLRQRFVWRRH